MQANVVGATSRFIEMANLFALEVPLSQFEDEHPDQMTPEPRPYITEEDRLKIQQITGRAGEVLNQIGAEDPWQKDEAAYSFLLALEPFARRYFPGQISS
jgi:hypothetical protein